MSQLMRLWYLSHRGPVKAQVSLCIHAVSPEPSLFAHMKNGSRRRVRQKKSDILSHWMVVHAQLKNEFTEDEKFHNLKTWLKYRSPIYYDVKFCTILNQNPKYEVLS